MLEDFDHGFKGYGFLMLNSSHFILFHHSLSHVHNRPFSYSEKNQN